MAGVVTSKQAEARREAGKPATRHVAKGQDGDGRCCGMRYDNTTGRRTGGGTTDEGDTSNDTGTRRMTPGHHQRCRRQRLC